MKKNVVMIFSLFCFISIHAQWTDVDVSIGGGYNSVLGDHDWTSGSIIVADVIAIRQFSNGMFIGLGIGYMDNEVMGLRDYSPQLPCDISHGLIDTLNSYFEYGNDRSFLLVPMSVGYKTGRIEWAIGVDWLINTRTDPKTYLVKCGGTRVDAFEEIEKETWYENNVVSAINLQANIGLFKSQRLRVIPRVRYVISPTEVSGHGSFNELQYLLSVGYRIWRVE
jgi:hypothetical protein